MENTYPEIRKFSGLFLQKNSFNAPDGAMEQAMNLAIEEDDRIVKLRAFYEYFAPGTGTLNNLFKYQNRLLLAYNDKLTYVTETGAAPNTVGTDTTLTGRAVSLTDRVARFAEASSNCYMTSDDGVLKIDAFNGKVFEAGVPPGLDLQATWLPAVTGFLSGEPTAGVPNSSAVGYRLLFGRTDANSMRLLGAPSDFLTVTNSVITARPYTSAVDGGGGYMVTVTSPNHQLTVGSTIFVKATDVDADGERVICGVTDANTFCFLTTLDPASGTLDYSASRNVRIEASIPDEIDTVDDGYFVRVYRSRIAVSLDPVPDTNYTLVEERMLTASEIANHLLVYDDVTVDVLVESQPRLYTNPTEEGELQANMRPPKCEDLTIFKDCLIAAGVRSRHILNLSLVDVGVLADGDYFEVKLGGVTRRYVCRQGAGNTTISSPASYAGSTVTVTSAAHNLLSGDTVQVGNAVGVGALPSGQYVVSAVPTADTFQFSFVGGTSLERIEFQGVKDASNYFIFTLYTSGSVARNLAVTARGFVKAINRDGSAPFYGRYVSGIDSTPGLIRIDAEDFGGAIYVRANGTAEGTAFSPELPSSFASGTQVYSQDEDQPHVAMCSKPGESEAFPIDNDIKVGEKNGRILRALALRDSVIFLKTDGVYRMTGDNPSNFDVTPIDTTAICIAASSAVLLNNQVYFLSNQGVCVVTESAVTVISRERIEDVITPIVGKSAISSETAGIAYESNRTYRLSTIGPNDDARTVCYVFNFVTNAWTQQEKLFKQGLVGPNDRLYIIGTDNKLYKERKDYKRTDHCGQHHATTITSVSADKKVVVIQSLVHAPGEGDAILYNDTINRVKSVVDNLFGSYTVTFRRPTNLVAATTPLIYEAYDSVGVFTPFHAGQVGLMKLFSKIHFHTRSRSVSRLTVSFSGYTYGGSAVTEWEAEEIEQGSGWGNFPWGYEPFGEADTTNIETETKPALPIRILVPLYQQRNTYLKIAFRHSEAGESIDIQALVLVVRAYKERVSK